MSTFKSIEVILGDSHLKGSVPRINNCLSSKFEVGVFIKLAAGFVECKEDTFGIIQCYKDVFVCNDGANKCTTVTQKM
jgi:hypothetical protein